MRLRFIILLWLLALAVSSGYRCWRGLDRKPLADQSVLRVHVDPSVAHDGTVDLAFRDLHADRTGTPILLLHGNPMAGRVMLPLARELGDSRRILVPDLPGMGFSGKNLTAYSAVNQVSVLLEWLDQLGVEKVHVVGYSQGSAVALELANRAPARVESVSLIAGVGLQSYELLGNYAWNQPLYTIFDGFLWSLRWLTPHFGYFDSPVFSPTTARNFADTDLRRNRAILEHLETPALILHSVTDQMVPFAAALAHARLLPQAVFLALPGGHLGIFKDTATYAGALNDFVDSVESGTALTRTDTLTQGRANQPALAIDLPERPSLIHNLIMGSLLFLFVFVSEDLACIAGGILAASGMVSLSAAILGCFFGIFISDVALYIIGRVLGSRALRLSFVAKAADGSTFSRLREGYARKSFQVVFLTRFIPGSRVIAYITAGMIKLPFLRFTFWLGLAAALWTPILVVIAFWAGRPLIAWWDRSGIVVLPLVALGLAGIYIGLHVLTESMTYRGRRLLRGQWVRLTQWEFWPALPVYIPVFFYGCYLALRYRSATVWAACNPGMYPASGLALESKSEILAALNAQTGCVADWARIKASDTITERLAALESFQERNHIEWPLVLKPDIGQRGEGVAVIRGRNEAIAYLTHNRECVIAQRYIGGEEFGVFYYRVPGMAESHLFSITEKVLPVLQGDGVRTVERLILDDPRAVALAKHYLKVNAGRLREVPAVGQSIQLVDLGTHCRGAIFLDGNRYQSEALRQTLDRVLSTYEGFCFGRFDVRVPSGKSLMQGEGIQILELNGVSSESTDIYDPKNSIFTAWRVLCRQWELAFRIGAANRANGAAVPSLKEIFSVLRGHRQRSPYEVEPVG